MNNLFPLLLLVLFAVVVLLPMRARNRQAMRVREMQQSLTVGTEIMTTSGLYGRITRLGDQSVHLEIAPGVTVEWARAAIAEVRSPGEPGTTSEGPAEAVGE